MTRIAEIKTAIRHMLAGTAKVLGAAAVVLLLYANSFVMKRRRRELGIGTTDMGNVTHEVPGLQSYIQVVPLLRGHTPEFEKAQ